MREEREGLFLRQAIEADLGKSPPDFAGVYQRLAGRRKRRVTWGLTATSVLAALLLIQSPPPPPSFDRQVEVFVAGLWED